MKHKLPIVTFCFAALFVTSDEIEVRASEPPKPVKVFILAGQSNMEGQGIIAADPNRNGGKGSLEYLVREPSTAARFAHLVGKDGKWVVLRVPYPTGFYTKWMDGRIDDAKAGWKGKGLWATVSTRTPFHMETGKGTTSKVMHFQLRPDPLAK